MPARAFLVARNPEPGSRLPDLIRLPLPDGPLVLKAAEPWPRTAKVVVGGGKRSLPDNRVRVNQVRQEPAIGPDGQTSAETAHREPRTPGTASHADNLLTAPPNRGAWRGEICLVHLALHNTNLNPLVEGPTLLLAPVHGKVRRDGYRKTAAP
jgi:hypothetical protein